MGHGEVIIANGTFGWDAPAPQASSEGKGGKEPAGSPSGKGAPPAQAGSPVKGGPPAAAGAGKAKSGCFGGKKGKAVQPGAEDVKADDKKPEECEKSVSQGPTLQDINLHAKPGSLTAIIGSVGSGKSSMLAALLGTISKKDGSAAMGGRVAYVAQSAWVMNDTLQENVLMGEEMRGEE